MIRPIAISICVACVSIAATPSTQPSDAYPALQKRLSALEAENASLKSENEKLKAASENASASDNLSPSHESQNKGTWTLKKNAPPEVAELFRKQPELRRAAMPEAKQALLVAQSDLEKCLSSSDPAIKGMLPEARERLRTAKDRVDGMAAGQVIVYPKIKPSEAMATAFKKHFIGLVDGKLNLIEQVSPTVTEAAFVYPEFHTPTFLGGSARDFSENNTSTYAVKRQYPMVVIGLNNASWGSEFTVDAPVMLTEQSIQNADGGRNVRSVVKPFNLSDYADFHPSH